MVLRFINIWSYKCAHCLTNKLEENHEKKRIYYYGFQVLIGGIVKAVIFLITAYLVGALVPIIATVFFFGFIRTVAGGYHMDKFDKCLVTSLALFVGAGLIAKYAGPVLGILPLSFLTAAVFILGLYVLIKYAPSDTPNKPIVNPSMIKKLKIVSIVNLCIWAAANYILIYFSQNMFALAGCIGVLLALFIVSPPGYAFFDAISGKLFSHY